MDAKQLKENVANAWNTRYFELQDKIMGYIDRESDKGYEGTSFSEADWKYQVDDERYNYPSWMYMKIMDDLKADGLDVKQWSILGIKLPYWSVKWGR